MSETPAPEPKPTSDLDDQFRSAARGLHRARWALAAVTTAVIIAALIILTLVVSGQQEQLRASCAFWRTLTGVPVQTAGPGQPPSRLAVSIVSGARGAYRGEGCGTPPPPSPSFVRWAPYYHLPAA